MGTIHTLGLAATCLNNLWPIAGMYHLRHLILESDCEVDFAPFAQRRSCIETLDVVGLPKVDLISLTCLPRLTTLAVTGDTTAGLDKMCGVSRLLIKTSADTDLSPVVSMVNLRRLEFLGDEHPDLAPLASRPDIVVVRAVPSS